MKYLLFVVLSAVFVSSCGGGNPDANDENGSVPSDNSDSPIDGDSGSNPNESTGNSEDADGTDPVDQEENADNTGLPDPDGVSEDDGSTDPMDAGGAIASGGRKIEVLLAQGVPAPGFPDEEVTFDAEQFVFSQSGQIAIRATVAGEPVIFIGDSSGLRPLIRRGDAMEGVANTVRFGDATELQWSSDDRLGFEVSLIGTETRTGYAIAEDNTVTVVVVPGISQVTDAQGALRTVTTVGSAAASSTSPASSISAAGVALQLRADGRLLAVLPKDGQLQFVTRRYTSTERLLEEKLDNGCPFSISEFTNETIRYLDDGSLLFEANEGTDFGSLEQCDEGSTLIRYSNGTFSTIVGANDVMPGPVDESFRFITLQNEIPTERIFVTSGVDGRTGFSIWDVSETASTDLVLLDGEQVQLATRSGPIDSPSVSEIDSLGQRVAAVVEASNSVALLAGNRRDGQPHSNFEEPGASSLPVIVSGDGEIPEGFNSTGFWSQLRRPSIANAETLYFSGRISDAISGSVIDESLWESNFEGQLNLVLSVGDEVMIGDDIVEPIMPGAFSSPGIDLLQNVVTTPEGGLILMVNTNGSPTNNFLSSREVLIYLPGL